MFIPQTPKTMVAIGIDMYWPIPLQDHIRSYKIIWDHTSYIIIWDNHWYNQHFHIYFAPAMHPPVPGAHPEKLILRVDHPDARRAIVAAQDAQQEVGHGVHLGIEKPQTLICHVDITGDITRDMTDIWHDWGYNWYNQPEDFNRNGCNQFHIMTY